VRVPLQQGLRVTESHLSVAEGLRDILSMLNVNRTEKDVLAFICKQATESGGAVAAGVYRFDEEAQVSALLVGLGLPVELARIESVDLPEFPLSGATACQPLLWPNWEPLPSVRVQPPTSDPSQQDWLGTVRSYFAGLLGVPLMIRGEVYGGLFLFYADQRRAFTKQEIDVACAIGEQAALAVENTYLRIEAEQAAISTERARLARDLHDSVTQILFSASLVAEALPRLWEKDQAEGRFQLVELRSLTKSALAEMRGLLFELRPTALLKSPLPETLRYLVEGAAGRASIPITLTTIGKTPLPPEVKVAFYRIAQEALNNVVKHANADNASVTLERYPERAELCIMDNGRGFIADAVAHDRLGLNIMHERSQTIGALLRVESHPGQGTRITVTWHRPETKA
jgi:signal transduction histidine kinase